MNKSARLPRAGWGYVVLAVVLLSVGARMQFAPPIAPAAPLDQTCSPRPPVGVNVVPDAPSHLQVTITANTNASTPTNQLLHIQLQAVTNAQVFAGLMAQQVPFTIPLPPGTTSTQLGIHQLNAGEAVTVTMLVTDNCGDWPTFVGSGVAGFPTPTPTPTLTRSPTPTLPPGVPSNTPTPPGAATATASPTRTSTAVPGTATPTSTSTNTPTPTRTATPTATNTPTTPDLTIQKSHSGSFRQGQTSAQYTITVTNSGSQATSGTVTVTDTLPAGLTATALSGTGWSCVLGTLTCTRGDALAPGVSYATITLTVDVAANAAASVTNTATVSGGGDSVVGNNTANDPTTIIQVANLQMQKAHSGNFQQGQANAQYTLTVNNAGPGPTDGSTVTVTDTLPAVFSPVSASGTGWTCPMPVGQTVTCTRTDVLAVGQSYPAITLVVSVANNAGGSATNTATVAGGGELNTGDNSASDPTTITQLAALTVAKSNNVSNQSPQSGTWTWALAVTNGGSGAASFASGQTILTDALPSGASYTPQALTNVTGVTGQGNVNCAVAAGVLTCTATGAVSIAAGGTFTLPVLVSPSAAGTLTNPTGGPCQVDPNNSANELNTPAQRTCNSDSVLVIGPPSLAKAFGGATVALNGTTPLTFTITNPNSTVALSGVAFSDTLPAGLVAANGTTTGVCGAGSTLTVTGGDTITLTGGGIAANGQCQFAVPVTGTTAGAKTNTTGTVSSTNGGAGATAQASVTVMAPPTIAKAFGAATIALNGTGTLTFTLTNPNTTVGLTGVAFGDTLPAGLTAANGTTNNVCGSGSALTITGTDTITLSGGSIGANSQCQFSVTVTGTTAGSKVNTTGTVTSTEGGTGLTATASVGVVAPPTISKAFGVSSIALNGTTTLTLTITNPAGNAASLTGVGFSDALPAGLQVAATPNASTSGCGSPTFAPASGDTTLTFSGGSVAVGTPCTVSVSVTSTTAGDKVNTTGAVTSTEGGTGTASNTATLSVVAPPTISKAFGASSIGLNGTTTLTLTITNPAGNTASLTGVGVTDSFPAGLQVAATPNASTSGCGSPTFSPASGDTSLTLSGATVAVGTPCTVSVSVTGTTAGDKANTTAAPTSTNGGTGVASNTATLSVLSPPVVEVSFLDQSAHPVSSIPLDGTVTLSFNFGNTNASVTLTNVSVTTTLPSGLTAANGTSSGTCGASITVTNNDTITISGATIPPGICGVADLTVTATSAGHKTVTTGAPTSSNGGTGTPASASIDVVAPPTISKAFGASSIGLNGTTTLQLLITNPAGNTVSLTGVGVTDSFPAGLQVAATPNASTSGCGSPTFSPQAGDTSLTLSGATVAVGTPCQVSVSVTSTTTGSKANTTGAVSSTNGGTGTTSNTATLVVLSPPTISKAFGASAVVVNGTVTLTFTIQNPNAATLSGVAFSDSLPAGLVVAATPNVSTSGCGGSPNMTATAGSGTISLSGGALAAGGTCTVSVDVTRTTTGTKSNTTGAVSATETGAGSASNTATVTVFDAVDDSYSAYGNIQIALDAAHGVLVNDSLQGATLTSFSRADGSNSTSPGGTLTTAAGSNVVLQSDGSFTFNPGAGLRTSDSFKYTVTLSGVTDTATVTVSILDANTGTGATGTNVVWFVDASAGAGGNGRATAPFNSISAFNSTATDAVGDIIYVKQGTYSAAAGFTLLNAQQLLGNSIAPSLPARGTSHGEVDSIPSTGSAPTVGNTGGAAVTLGQNNTVRGLSFGNSSGAAITGTNFGTLTVDTVSINSTGPALNLDTGTLTGSSGGAAFSAITSSGGTNNILLNAVATTGGTADLGSGGALSGASGDAFKLTGQNGSFSYGGSITNASTLAVNIASKTGGTVTLSGDINPGAANKGISVSSNNSGTNTITFSGANKKISTGSGTGVSLSGNTGATITFSNGGLAITTTSGTGFNATGGAAAVNVTGSGNTITSTTGTALNVVNTSIGSNHLVFDSISANGATNGIVLSGTGTAGGLHVLGNGSTAQGGDASGGTIQNTTGAGISLNDTTGLQLNNIKVTNTANAAGITGTSVTNFSLTNSEVSNSGGTSHGSFDSNVSFANTVANSNNVDGTVTITNNKLTNAYQSGVDIENTNGTISALDVSNNLISSSTNPANTVGSGVKLVLHGASTTAAGRLTKGQINSNTISNFPTQDGILVDAGNTFAGASGAGAVLGTDAGANRFQVINNSINGTAAAPIAVHYIIVSIAGFGSGFIDVSGNGSASSPLATPMTNVLGTGISINATGAALMTAVVNNNRVDGSTQTGGADGVAGGTDQQGLSPSGTADSAVMNLTASGNVVNNTDGVGIYFLANSQGTLNARIQSNTVGAPRNGTRPGIRVDSGSSVGSAVDTTVCLQIGGTGVGNTATGVGGFFDGIAVRKQGTVQATNVFGIVGLTPNPSDQTEVTTYIRSQNPGDTPGSASNSGVIAGDNFTTCTLPF